MQYWLFKSETTCFSIEDLQNSKNQTTSWDGVRNYQARNFMRNDMSVGDLGFFYHSGKNPEIAGIVKVVSGAYPDHTALDQTSDHYDPAATVDNPRWYMVDVQLVTLFQPPIPRTILKIQSQLAGMELLRVGSRLSIQPVSEEHFEYIKQLSYGI